MISIIVAVAENNVIGGGNQLLWHISEDLRRFKNITSGHPVVMGRKTFESIGRPLPGRTNIVISRNPQLRIEGCLTASSLENALRECRDAEEVFIIGGGEIYRQAIDIADKIYVTKVEQEYEGDTYFPEIDEREWSVVFQERHERGKDYSYPFTFVDYERTK